jgi:DNA processing protein
MCLFLLQLAQWHFLNTGPISGGSYQALSPKSVRNKMTDVFAKLRLIRTDNVGPVSYRQLIARFGNAEKALLALPDLTRRGGGKFQAASQALIEKELAHVKALGARHIFVDDIDYPPLLAEIENGPAAIMVVGNLALTDRPVVSMVGARNASAAACRFARNLALDLSADGIAVASGLARGVDTAAHYGSLENGTIGVIAGGIDITYPPENAELQRAVGEKGLLIAEMPPGTEPRARHFPHRNRIIAGLALGTVVVEAVPKSGSLITARLAGEYGREVMAVPGSPLDPRARGCNQLIREGATLVQDANDIAELVRPLDLRMPLGRPQVAALELPEAGDPERCAVNDLLGMSFVSIDEIVRQSGLSSPLVQSVLLEYELAGRLERGAGAKVRLTA